MPLVPFLLSRAGRFPYRYGNDKGHKPDILFWQDSLFHLSEGTIPAKQYQVEEHTGVVAIHLVQSRALMFAVYVSTWRNMICNVE